jgi:hypothetical protein
MLLGILVLLGWTDLDISHSLRCLGKVVAVYTAGSHLRFKVQYRKGRNLDLCHQGEVGICSDYLHLLEKEFNCLVIES